MWYIKVKILKYPGIPALSFIIHDPGHSAPCLYMVWFYHIKACFKACSQGILCQTMSCPSAYSIVTYSTPLFIAQPSLCCPLVRSTCPLTSVLFHLTLLSVILALTSLFTPVFRSIPMATNLGPKTSVWARQHIYGERVETREKRDQIQNTLQTWQWKIPLSGKASPALQLSLSFKTHMGQVKYSKL